MSGGPMDCRLTRRLSRRLRGVAQGVVDLLEGAHGLLHEGLDEGVHGAGDGARVGGVHVGWQVLMAALGAAMLRGGRLWGVAGAERPAHGVCDAGGAAGRGGSCMDAWTSAWEGR